MTPTSTMPLPFQSNPRCRSIKFIAADVLLENSLYKNMSIQNCIVNVCKSRVHRYLLIAIHLRKNLGPKFAVAGRAYSSLTAPGSGESGFITNSYFSQIRAVLHILRIQVVHFALHTVSEGRLRRYWLTSHRWWYGGTDFDLLQESLDF
jgi:hypothetical protein